MRTPIRPRLAPGSTLAALLLLVSSSAPRAQACESQVALGGTVDPCWVDFFDDSAAVVDAGVPQDDQEKDMVTADFDLDGDTDVLIVRKVPVYGIGGDPHILLLNQGGVFVDASGTIQNNTGAGNELPSRDVCVLNANGDDWPDFAVSNSFGQRPRLWLNAGVSGGVFQGFTEVVGMSGTFYDPPATCNAPNSCGMLTTDCSDDLWSCALQAGDLDGDGYDDLWVSTYGIQSVATPSVTGDRIYRNRGDGSGMFDDVTWDWIDTSTCNLLAYTGGMTSAFVGDFDGDGLPDLFRGGPFTSQEILWNDDPALGTPVFTTRTVVAGGFYMAGVADLDGDGDLDIYLVADQCDRVRINPGGAAARNAANWGTYDLLTVLHHNKLLDTGGNMVFADVDGDGFTDVAVCDVDVADPSTVNAGAPYFTLLRNRTTQAGVFGGLEDVDSQELLTVNVADTSVYDAVWIDPQGDGMPGFLMGVGRTDLSGVPIDGEYRFLRLLPFGENQGTAVPNSTGSPATMGFAGRPSLSENAFQLRATGALPGASGEFIYGFTTTSIPLYDGLLLVGPQFQRLPTIQADANGTYVYDVDFSSAPFASGPAAVQPCDTVYFQLFYRDPGSTNTGANFSDRLEVTLWE